MVDEDVVIGYALGWNDGVAAGGGADPDEIKKAFENGYRLGYDDGYDDGKDGKDYGGTPPDVSQNAEYKPTVEGAEYPYLVGTSSDEKHAQVMYGIEEYDESLKLPTKHYYVDHYVNGQLTRHESSLIVLSYNQMPSGNKATLLSDGSVRVTSYWNDGIHDPVTKIWGPFINSAYATVWSI